MSEEDADDLDMDATIESRVPPRAVG